MCVPITKFSISYNEFITRWNLTLNTIVFTWIAICKIHNISESVIGTYLYKKLAYFDNFYTGWRVIEKPFQRAQCELGFLLVSKFIALRSCYSLNTVHLTLDEQVLYGRVCFILESYYIVGQRIKLSFERAYSRAPELYAFTVLQTEFVGQACQTKDTLWSDCNFFPEIIFLVKM